MKSLYFSYLKIINFFTQFKKKRQKQKRKQRPLNQKKMSMNKKCPRCGKTVYYAERALGPGGNEWHKACFRCKECKKGLDSTTCREHDGEIYCKTCHAKAFGPHGYGFCGGGAMMHTQATPAAAPPPPASGGGAKLACKACKTPLDKPCKFCPECGAPQ